MTHATLEDLEAANERLYKLRQAGDLPDDVAAVQDLLDYYKRQNEDAILAKAQDLLDSGKIRICDKPACSAAIVKSEGAGRTMCAAGHDTRLVEVRQLRAWQERAELLRGLIEEAVDANGADEFVGFRNRFLSVLDAVPPPPSRGDAADRAEERLLALRQFFWQNLGGLYNRLDQITVLMNPDALVGHGFPVPDPRFFDEVPEYPTSPPRDRVPRLAAALSYAIEEIKEGCDCHPEAMGPCGACRQAKDLEEALDYGWPSYLGDPAEKLQIDKFTKDDWASFHDVVWEADGRKLPKMGLKEVFKALPQSLRENAYHFGLGDSVVRDEIFAYLKAEKAKADEEEKPKPKDPNLVPGGEHIQYETTTKVKVPKG